MESGQETRIQIALATTAKKSLALAVCLVPVALYVALAAAHFQAARLTAVPTLARLESASRLDPWNAEYPDLIGRYYLFVLQKPAKAISFFHSALTLNPYASRYWLDLSAAHLLLGHRREQETDLANALAIDSKTPSVAWEAANVYMTLGETDSALHALRAVMEGAPWLQPAALEYCWRLRPDVPALLRDTVPMDGGAPAAFLELLIAKNQSAAAGTLWASIVQTQYPLESRYVFNYVQYLIGNHAAAKATQAWSEGTKLAGLTNYQSSPQNLVVNGNFRLAILNAGLDWRYQQSPDVSLALDPVQSQSGLGSLQMAFDSHSLKDAGIRQFIPVMANTRYEFSAFCKTEQLQGAGGLHFVIQDDASATTYFESEALISEDGWKKITGEFATGSDAEVATLGIQRFPAGDAIRGKLWIDDVRIIPGHRLAEAQR
jgi:tetratricopeptide (TPR) repeat protein